MATAPHKQCY
uniref:Uncharacterized protein n=1 Tax=Arundo donax TaxID=35708 RepID=A0A0A9B535_ARUDO